MDRSPADNGKALAMRTAIVTIAASLIVCGAARAQGKEPVDGPCPPAVTSGSGDVVVGGKQAARAGDRAGCGQIVEGSPDVMINGRPAAILGSGTECGGKVVAGSSNVFINGKPVARVGDAADCAK